MSKARDLADSVSTGGILEDGAVSVSEISDLTVTAAELNNVAGVNSDVQTQLDLKAPLASPTFTGDATFDTNTLYVDSTNNRVGIGTTNPTYSLQVATTSQNHLNLEYPTVGSFGFQVLSSNALVINDDSTERMRIDSSGNVGIGTTNPDAKLKVTATGANLLVGYSGTQNYFDASENIFRNFSGTEHLRIGSSGQLGLSGTNYGTSGQVLTSGGSGAAPTWADAGGGGAQYDFTADGAISAGDVVALTGSGNAKVTEASSYTTPSDTGFAAGITGDKSYHHATCPRTGRKIFVATYANNVYAIGYTYSSGTFTYGSNTLIRSGNTKGENIVVVATGRADGEFAILYQNANTNHIFVRIVTVASNRTVSNRGDGEYNVDSIGDQILHQRGTTLIGGANQTSPVIACLHDNRPGSEYEPALTAIQVNSSNVSVGSTYGGISGPGSGSDLRISTYANLVWDSTNSRLIAAWRSNGAYTHLRFVTNSGTTLTIGSRIEIDTRQSNNAYSNFNLVWSDNANHAVVFHYYSSDFPVVARVIDSSGVAVGTYTPIENTLNNASASYNVDSVILDVDKDIIVYRMRIIYEGSYHYAYHASRVDASGGFKTLTSPGYPIKYVDEGTNNYRTYDPVGNIGFHYDTYNNIIQAPYTSSANSNFPYNSTITVGTTYDFLGIADNTVTSGQTVTVNLAGSVDQNQTGLTTGATYYIGSSGALTGGSGDRKVGKALSSTAILITSAND